MLNRLASAGPTVEGAVLFPGDALQNVDGYAITSWLLQTRATFFL